MASVIIIAAITVRLVVAFTGTGIATPLLDNLALLAAGAIFGASASTAVNGKAIEAAHKRLDYISAPPSQFTADNPPGTDPGAV